MRLPEFGDGLPAEPDDIDRIIEDLMPEKCRGCTFLELGIGMMLAFQSSTGGPWDIADSIEKHCTGWEGEVTPSQIESAGEQGIVFPISGDDHCPYRRYIDGLNG